MLWLNTHLRQPKKKTPLQNEKLSAKQVKRNAFTLCVVHRSINAALVDFKLRMCDPATQVVNYNKTVNVLPHG